MSSADADEAVNDRGSIGSQAALSTDPLVLPAPEIGAVDDLDGALWNTFSAARDALSDDRAVVIQVSDRDLLGQGDPLQATFAHAAVGLCRALAIEGERDGWRINVLATGDDPNTAAEWAMRLGVASGLSGVVLRLGTAHLGRLPV